MADETNWLDENGICAFTGPASRIPSAVRLSNPDLQLMDLIKSFVIKNPTGAGTITVDYNSIRDKDKPLPAKIIAAVLDMDLMQPMLDEPDGILLRSPNGDDWMTLDEWKAEFNTDGFPLILRARLFNVSHGGGVSTPGQQVTGTHQTGQSRPADPNKKVQKIGGSDGRRHP